MKRRDVIKKIRRAAKAQGVSVELIELTNHTGVVVGGSRTVIARQHRDRRPDGVGDLQAAGVRARKGVVAMSRRTYDVTVVHEGKWWIATVPEVPGAVSQVRRLSQVEEAITEAISFVAQVDDADVGVRIDVQVLHDVMGRIEVARRAVADAEQAQREAAELSRAAAKSLIEAGLSGYDAAEVMGVSPQRISQLVNS